jgi:hypothetical protein
MDDPDHIHNQQMREAAMLVGSYMWAWGQLETTFASGFHNIAPHRRGPHIDPKDISKTISHLAREWGKEVKKIAPKQTKRVDDLVTAIIAHALDRNTICHGWQGVITKQDSSDFVIACWHKFHEMRSLGKFPEQRFFDRSKLEQMIWETQNYQKQVRGLTEHAQIEREKARVAAELSEHQIQAHQDTPRP